MSCPHCALAEERIQTLIDDLTKSMPEGEPQHLFASLASKLVEVGLGMAPESMPLMERYALVAENFVTVLNILLGRALEEAGELPSSDPMSRLAKAFADERNAA